MAFTIYVQNDGDEGTVSVIERLSLNESTEVYRQFMGANTKASVNCVGDAPKDFTWTHLATNLSGGPETLGDQDTLRVSS